MKKTIFITIGVVIIILILGIWAYLFTYGKPASTGDIFANFGIGGGDAPEAIQTDDTKIDVTGGEGNEIARKLRQLTTRPVAGALFVNNSIRYVEQGTGHIYEIDLSTGTETLLLGTTIPQAASAVFSGDGSSVAITTYSASGNKTVLQTVKDTAKDTSVEGAVLPEGATEIYFGNSTTTLKYLLKDTSGASGYVYSLKNGTGKQLFTTPLRDVHVLWGDTNYVYTTPTSLAKGYLYRTGGAGLEYVTNGGTGLTGFTYNDKLIISTITDGLITSRVETAKGDANEIGLGLIPEKCTPNLAKKDSLYCSVPLNLEKGTFPDAWYKGTVSYSDALWEVSLANEGSGLLVNFLTESGREIDVSKIGTNDDGTFIYLVNKNDNTLWMYDTL